ncbi:MAG: DoxX family protein [Acidobacteria bacterium]|nr:DoxX family protein [Acidobacteriota bacterium]
MTEYLGRHEGRIYAVFRIVVGFLFMFHGLQKILGLFGGMDGSGATPGFLSLIWFAGLIELVGGFLVMIGLFASWAAFVSSGEMAVAYFYAHFPQAFWPAQNQGELAALYCFVFLYIAARGDGPWSVTRAAGHPKAS